MMTGSILSTSLLLPHSTLAPPSRNSSPRHQFPPILLHRGFAPPRRSPSFPVRGLFPVDPWAPTVDSQSVATQLFAASLFPYLGFLYFLTKSRTAPKLTLFGFYFLLAFVGATIPAGIYAKVKYGTSLSNVDWLHGSAESLLALTNLFIVLGLRDGLRKLKVEKKMQRSLPQSSVKRQKFREALRKLRAEKQNAENTTTELNEVTEISV